MFSTQMQIETPCTTRNVAGGQCVSLAEAFQIHSLKKKARVLGTACVLSKNTNVRAASSWLSARRSVSYFIRWEKSLGTELLWPFRAMVRTVSGWLSVRPSFLSLPSEVKTQESKQRWTESYANHTGSVRPSVDGSETKDKGKGYHLPVFPVEVCEWMEPCPGRWIIDGTLGGGGHSEIFLAAGSNVLGIDRDPEALAHARHRLSAYGDRFDTWEGNFSHLLDIPVIRQGAKADGLLLDLGVSSRQLDSPSRGFSFMQDGPLDMRMGPSSPRSAADVINDWSEEDLAKILFEFGEEPKGRRIAAAIAKQRKTKRFETTTELAACIEACVGRHGRTHPATRSFQAIRMAVNEELESLAHALSVVPALLKPGGRLLIITFHSLEDRMVKRFLRHRSSQFIDDPSWPEPKDNPDFHFDLLSRKAIVPQAEEIFRNPRARSAKLRVARYKNTTP